MAPALLAGSAGKRKREEMTYFVLMKVGFDSMENCHARYEEPVAVFTTKEKLDAELLELGKLKTYRGYDGETYPQYRFVELPVDRLPPMAASDQIRAEQKVDGRWLTDEQRSCEPGANESKK